MMTIIKFMVFIDLLHWKVIDKYHLLNLIFDSLRFLMLEKLSLLLAQNDEKTDCFNFAKLTILMSQKVSFSSH